MPILSFHCKDTEALHNQRRIKRFQAFEKSARNKLMLLDNAGSLLDLNAVPSLRLHSLDGDRQGQHSISINMQYRICFIWSVQGPTHVEIVDYH
jgi:proteic killer suppression protein